MEADYKEFMDAFTDAIVEVADIEEYDETTEYLDENGQVLFVVRDKGNNDNVIVEFYEEKYNITVKFFTELMKALKKYIEQNPLPELAN